MKNIDCDTLKAINRGIEQAKKVRPNDFKALSIK